jgi:2',3'-cyclic-nucleotide 2'-phosphodiesterase/3'-nucleotidase
VNPSGGLARRAWVVRQIKQRYAETPVLLLDSGDFSDNPTPAGDVKTQGLLQAMEQLGYRIVNVGERDIRMGYDEFVRRTASTKLTYISANIVDRKTAEPVFQPHAIVDAVAPQGQAQVRVGVIGVVRFNPVFLKTGPRGGQMVIDQPAARVKREMEALAKEKVDVVVLLAALHRNDTEVIVREVPGIDFVLGSYGGHVTPTEERVGQTTILYCGNRGQRVGESRVVLGPAEGPRIASQVTRLHTLTAVYPQEDDMLKFVSALPRDAPEGTAPAAAPAVQGQATGSGG